MNWLRMLGFTALVLIQGNFYGVELLTPSPTGLGLRVFLFLVWLPNKAKEPSLARWGREEIESYLSKVICINESITASDGN